MPPRRRLEKAREDGRLARDGTGLAGEQERPFERRSMMRTLSLSCGTSTRLASFLFLVATRDIILATWAGWKMGAEAGKI